MAKNCIHSGEPGWYSGLGLGLVDWWSGDRGFESRLDLCFFFSSTFENFLSFLAGYYTGTRSTKLSVPVPVR